MKNIIAFAGAICSLILVTSCNSTESYADQKKRERTVISKFICDSVIKVISEAEFISKNHTTDVSKNEFVLFESSGVYMQIVRQGCGEKIQNGETSTILCRYYERNLLTDSIQISNNVHYFALNPDKISISNNNGIFEALFISGVMPTLYKGTQVPEGWLVPLTYINVGRPTKEDDEIAKVKLIVPHTKGQKLASNGVYPCFYEITYEKGR